jgi:transposase
MIRTTEHSLKFITDYKKQKLDILFVEYQRVVNCYINVFWNQTSWKSKATADEYKLVDSWLMGKVMKCAYAQAIQIIRSTKDKQKKLVYKQYKRVYSKAKRKNKNWDIVNLKFTDWSKGKKFRDRTKMPFFSGDSIELNSDLCKIYQDVSISHFDMVVRLGSIWGNRLSLELPIKKHKHFNQLLNCGFTVKSSLRLSRKNDKYSICLYLSKEPEDNKNKGNIIGIDVGVKKLMTISDNTFVGADIESIIKKYKRRKQNSKNSKKTIKQIKDYIGYSVNQLDFENIQCIVLEDIKSSNMIVKGRVNKEFRKTLSKWNHNLLVERVRNKCELNRVELQFVINKNIL